MKKTKIIIPALGMLLLSTAASITGTVAWFSANTSVTASSMNISATTGGSYLVVNEEIDETNTTYETSANSMILNPASGTGLKLVTPLNVASNVQYYADAAAALADSKTTPTKFTNAASVLWGTASSSNPGQVQASNVTTLVDNNNDLDEYVQKSELFFKVLPGNTGANLKCTQVTFVAGTNSIAASGRVLLVSETGKYQLFKLVNGNVTIAEANSDEALVAEVTSTPAKITCFFYFDGTDNAAYTNNATDLTGVSASFAFAID